MNINLKYIEGLVAMGKKVPVIVEGQDDIPIYSHQALYSKNSKKIQVIPVEIIKKNKTDFYLSGCTGVIDFNNDVLKREEIIYGNKKLKDMCICIIDKDVRFHRDEIEEDGALCLLNRYSYENYCVERKLLLSFIKYYTYNKMLSDANKDIYKKFFLFNKDKENPIYILYLAHLEALKKALDDKYECLETFGTPFTYYDSKDSTERLEKLFDKKESLEKFGLDMGIIYNYKSLKKYIKGKWLIKAISKVVSERLKELKILCRDSQINQCIMCGSKKYDGCLYRVEKDIKIKDVEIFIRNNNHFKIRKIINRMNKLC